MLMIAVTHKLCDKYELVVNAFADHVRIRVFQVVCGLLLLNLVLVSSYSVPENNVASACSRRNSHLSCLLGCMKCAMVFGRKAYNMTLCCTECHESGAIIVDDGPDYCSHRFFVDHYTRR